MSTADGSWDSHEFLNWVRQRSSPLSCKMSGLFFFFISISSTSRHSWEGRALLPQTPRELLCCTHCCAITTQQKTVKWLCAPPLPSPEIPPHGRCLWVKFTPRQNDMHLHSTTHKAWCYISELPATTELCFLYASPSTFCLPGLPLEKNDKKLYVPAEGNTHTCLF